MRRSGSQLSNLSNYAGRRGYGAAASGQNANAVHYADEIQRRIDALGLGGDHLGQMPMTHDPFQAAEHHNPNLAYAPHPTGFQFSAQAPAMHQPSYANFPVPSYPPQAFPGPQDYHASAELNSIREAIHSLTGQMSAMQNQQTVQGATVAPKPSQELKQFAREIAELRQSMESAKTEIKADASSHVLDPDVYARVIKTSHADLATQIEDMRKSLAELSPITIDSEMFQKTIEASHDELKAQIEQLQNALDGGDLSGGLNQEYFEASHDQVLNQLSDIHSLLLANADNPQAVSQSPVALENIEMRLEEITRAVVALSHSEQSSDTIERVEARVNELSKFINNSEFGTTSLLDSVPQLENRLDDIVKRLDEISESGAATHLSTADEDSYVTALREMSEKLAALEAKVISEQGASDLGGLLSNPEALENLKQLSNSAAELNSKSIGDPQGHSVEKLEADVGYIVSFLEQMSSDGSDNANFADFTKKLSSIEEQLASNRDISIEMATQVAQDTVEGVMARVGEQSNIGSEEGSALSILGGLSEDIHKLQEASTHTNAQNLDAFSAIKDTLGSMVDRLSTLEQSASEQVSGKTPLISGNPSVPAEEALREQQVETVSDDHEIEEEAVPSIPSIDEFDQPVRLRTEREEEKATGQDVVAEYRALVSEQKEIQVKPEPQQVSIAQSLVEEAARAEEERRKLRATMNPAPSVEANPNTANASDDDREFHSAEMAIDTFDDEDLPQLPIAEAPELTTPSQEDESLRVDVGVEVEDRPLEPGSTGPDLAALVRKANETRKNRSKNGEGSSGTDFIAAARRAAQAAAEEASAAHEEVAKQEKEAGKSMLGSIPGLFSKRKKIISLAAVATLLAAISIPLVIEAFPTGDRDQFLETSGVSSSIEKANESREVAPVVNSPRIIEAAQELPDDIQVSVAAIEEKALSETQTNQAQPGIDTGPWLEDLTYVNDALKTAVAEGRAEAIYEVGRRNLEGIGVEKSAENALIWYMRAAEMGFAPAQYIVANLNEKAIGLKRNIPDAIKWYEKAADSGNVVSMHNLAVLNATPNPVTGEPDTATAFKWFKEAAGYGVKDSLVNLGIFYTKGVGTEVNLVEAYKWFTLAAKAGDDDAAKKREVIAEYMRPDQLELAKSKVEDWRPAERNQVANVYTPDPEWQSVAANGPIGDSPEVVKKAQALLGRLGYDAGPADGIMGAKTKQAIAEFQQRVGLSVSGELSRELLSELEAVAI